MYFEFAVSKNVRKIKVTPEYLKKIHYYLASYSDSHLPFATHNTYQETQPEIQNVSSTLKTLRTWLIFFLLCCTSVLTAIWLSGGVDARPFATIISITTSIGSQMNLLGKRVSDVVVNTSLRETDIRSGSSAVSYSGPEFDHTNDDRFACRRPNTQPSDTAYHKPIYKWVDAEGQTHMADKRPHGQVASIIDTGMSKRNFTYKIIPDGVSIPIGFSGQLSAGAKRIYDTWHFFLGEEKLRQSTIQLKLIGNASRFEEAYKKVSRTNRPVSGFYSIATNTAVVKFDPNSSQRTQATTFHETSHLITASHLCPTAAWLTEGLAEYFENMQVTGQGGTIYPNHAHIALLQKTRLPRLKTHLSINRDVWYGENRSQNYAIAWSLVYFLMSGSPGLYALQETVQQAEIHFCIAFSAMEALDSAYPGGLNRLEADWRKWLSAGDFTIQQT